MWVTLPSFFLVIPLSAMEVPPVLILLFELLPLFTIPPTLTYGTLKVAQEYLDFKIATWISITLSILAQPVLFILQRLYSSYRMERNAAAMGAVQAPRVQESDLAIVKGILNSFKHGYPGSSLKLTNVYRIVTYHRSCR